MNCFFFLFYVTLVCLFKCRYYLNVLQWKKMENIFYLLKVNEEKLILLQVASNFVHQLNENQTLKILSITTLHTKYVSSRKM